MPNPNPYEPTPAPTNPNPGAVPIEIDTGGLHSKPEVDYDQGADPELPTEPERVPPERETPAPDTEPG